MIKVDMKENYVQMTGDLNVVVMEFISIFDNLFDIADDNTKTMMVKFILDKSTGKFDEMFGDKYE